MTILDNADLIESVATARQTVGQLLIGQVKTINILQNQQTLGIDNDDRGETETARFFLGHDPEKTRGEQEHECQPTVICDTPDLQHTAALVLVRRLTLVLVSARSLKHFDFSFRSALTVSSYASRHMCFRCIRHAAHLKQSVMRSIN